MTAGGRDQTFDLSKKFTQWQNPKSLLSSSRSLQNRLAYLTLRIKRAKVSVCILLSSVSLDWQLHEQGENCHSFKVCGNMHAYVVQMCSVCTELFVSV